MSAAQHRPWVWFDLDDTLWDFATNSHHTLARVYDRARLNRFWPDVDSWRDAYHVVNHELWELYAHARIDSATLRTTRFARPLTQAGCPADEAEAMARELDPLYLHLLGQCSLTKPGAIELLAKMKDSYNIGILSNGFADTQYAKLRSSGLGEYIDCVVLSDQIGINKPDVRIFEHALRTAGTTAALSTMVGDNPDTDIAGALNAGWHAVWYNPEHCPVPAQIASNPRFSMIDTLDYERLTAILEAQKP